MSNFLITKTGSRYTTGGAQHNIYIQRYFKMTMERFLKIGGVRVKIFRDHMAVETGSPLTPKQKGHIKSALKYNDIYSLVISIGGKYAKKDGFQRPIRRI